VLLEVSEGLIVVVIVVKIVVSSAVGTGRGRPCQVSTEQQHYEPVTL
jgi:hypothetical protein